MADNETTFRGIRPDEQVLQTAKVHAWVLMPIAYCWLIIAGLFLASGYFFGLTGFSPYVFGIGTVVGLLYTWYQMFLWNNGVYVLTNQRVIKIDQNSLFNRQITEVEIDRIQEISSEIRGPIRTLFNFGTVHIQTASNISGRADLIDVANPYDLQQSILRVHNTEKRKPSSSTLR